MSSATPVLHIDDDTWVLVLTGAGVSAESGIPTFRDAGGLWEKHRVEDVASPEGFSADPVLVWRFYSQRRARMAGLSAQRRAPRARRARGAPRRSLPARDPEHRRPAPRRGELRVVELHGNLFKTRCSVCDRPPSRTRRSTQAAPYPPAVSVRRTASSRCSARTSCGSARRSTRTRCAGSRPS